MRESGFYWVKIIDKWTVGEFMDNDSWQMVGCDDILNDEDFDDIGERIPDRSVFQNGDKKRKHLLSIQVWWRMKPRFVLEFL